MVRDGEHGLLVDPGQPDELAKALEKLLASPELRRSLGTAARKRAEERFDLPALRERLGAIYLEAARARSRRRP
jgi:glycosyltransferase involved in cell wall biosynthesis